MFQWCNENIMAVNTDKTFSMLITTYQKAWRLPKQLLDLNSLLQPVTSQKLVGINTDHYLNWKEHTSMLAVCKSVSHPYHCTTKHITKYLPLEAREQFHNTNIQSHTDYCSTIWGPVSDTKQVFKLQKRTVRLITDDNCRVHTEDLFSKLNIMLIHDS